MTAGFQYSKRKVFIARFLEIILAPLAWCIRSHSLNEVRRVLIIEPYGLGDAANLSAAQQAYHHRARCNGAARSGKYSDEMERAT